MPAIQLRKIKPYTLCVWLCMQRCGSSAVPGQLRQQMNMKHKTVPPTNVPSINHAVIILLLITYSVIKKSLCTWRLHKNSVYSNNSQTTDELKWPSHNTFGTWTVLYWTRSSRTKFGVSGDRRGTLWILLVTFCNVIIRCTETFW
jgi:hypothetical protein